MRFESYLSTHPYYGFNIDSYLEKGKLSDKLDWVKEFKRFIDRKDLSLKVVSTIKGTKLIIFKNEGLGDEIKGDGTSIIDVDFINFTEDEVDEITEVFETLEKDIKSEASDELKKIFKEMKFVKPAHHIYFISNKDK